MIFDKLCQQWIDAVRAGLSYSEYKDIERALIRECNRLHINPDNIFNELAREASA